MADAKALTLDSQNEINRFHFTVGVVVLTAATFLSVLALRFLLLR
jgi:hypothetical protein